MSHINGNPIPARDGNGVAKDPLLSLMSMVQRYGVSLAPTALVFSRRLNIDEWGALGCVLWQSAKSHQWWIGDWWCDGSHSYGERKAKAKASTALGREYGTLANYGYVARAFETSRRRENVPWSHHYEVAPLSPEKQEHWLDIAERENLSLPKLQDKIFDAGDKTYSYHRYVSALKKAAQVPERFQIVEPCDNPDLEDFLKHELLLCLELLEAHEQRIDFSSRQAEFFRRILSEASVDGEVAERTVRVAEKYSAQCRM